MTLGLIFAALGTVLQALTYCLVKEIGGRAKLTPLQILLCAHLIMGLICLIPFTALNLKQYVSTELLTAAALVNLSYLFAQFFLFSAIARSDPSAASPYLILKLPLVALLSITIFGESLTQQQALALTGIVLLSLLYTGAVRVSLKVFLLVLLSAACFALCDIFVLKAVRALHAKAASPVQQSVYTVLICDVMFLVLLPLILFYKGKIKTAQLLSVTPLAASWILSVFAVIIGFNLAGIISGNIILSLRSVCAILLVALFFRRQLAGEGRFKIKGAAALGLCACAAVYYLNLQ